jgi:hypothetical protein
VALSRADLGRRCLLPAALAALMILTAGCGQVSEEVSGPEGSTDSPDRPAVEMDETSTADTTDAEPGPARQGSVAASQRRRFQPTQLSLPGGEAAPVTPATTVDGELVVPEDVQRLGWWDGGAYAGDPFGSTVVAGHIDSAEQGVGYFGQLLDLEPGQTVRVGGDGASLDYRVRETALIDKDALVTDSTAFDQTGEHRLVLITCWGRWRPEVSSYESNYVVVADPVGVPR